MRFIRFNKKLSEVLDNLYILLKTLQMGLKYVSDNENMKTTQDRRKTYKGN